MSATKRAGIFPGSFNRCYSVVRSSECQNNANVSGGLTSLRRNDVPFFRPICDCIKIEKNQTHRLPQKTFWKASAFGSECLGWIHWQNHLPDWPPNDSNFLRWVSYECAPQIRTNKHSILSIGITLSFFLVVFVLPDSLLRLYYSRKIG